MSERVFVCGLGASTAVGRHAWASAAAVRAAITGFAEHPSSVDSTSAPVNVAGAPWLDPALAGLDRFEALLLPAVDEALAVLPSPPASGRAALALGLPVARPGLDANLAAGLKARLAARYGGVFGSQALFEADHAGGLLALQAAYAKLSDGALDVCVVAGVDSWLAPTTLQWLEEVDRLHGAGPLNNAWGFIPGEAGAALLLANERTAQAMSLTPLATVLGAGSAIEKVCQGTDAVCVGDGLTACLRAALVALPAGGRVSDIYCDMNGEAWRADEFGFAALRTKAYFESPDDFSAPADCWGDVGAAGGVLHVMLACAAARKGYSLGALAMVWASAPAGERAAVLLDCGAPGRPLAPEH